MSREQIVDLLEYLGVRKIKNNPAKDNIQMCCPIHNEDNPSAGISIEKQVFHCFSCHATGGISWFLHLAEPDTFRSMQESDAFLKERYGVDFQAFDRSWRENGLRRFEDFDEETEEYVRFELPRVKLAPYKSGKETFQYFFDRGFNIQDVKDFMIGRDLVHKTVTIPVFWKDNVLAGIVGRKIDPKTPKNSRYMFMADFPKSALLYPQNYYKSERGRVVLVEGHLDAIWCHKHGFTEVQAMQTNALSKLQAEWILENCKEVVDFSDDDKMGEYATKSIVDRLKGEGVKLLTVKHLYPEGKKDPQQCTPEELYFMLEEGHEKSMFAKKIRRM